MGKREELEAEIAARTEELSKLQDVKETAEGKAADLKAAGKPKLAAEQTTIAAASEDTMHELIELNRALIKKLEAMGIGKTDEGKTAVEKQKSFLERFDEWLAS